MRHFSAVFGSVVLGVGSIAAAANINLDVTIRDFQASHPDFEQINSAPPPFDPPGWYLNSQFGKIEKGIAGPIGSPLGLDGDPVHSNTRDAGFFNTAPNAATFDEWWDDVPGTNISIPKTLTFVDQGNGTYTFNDQAFFPIDGEGFGNEGLSNNFHFTMELRTTFTYQLGQQFSFTGDDDLFLYIDKKLVVDVGGVHQALNGSVDLDTLGLVVGNTYDFDLFYTERNTTASTIAITTSIPLGDEGGIVTPPPGPNPIPLPAAAWMGLSMLGGMGVVSKLRSRFRRA